MISLLTYAKALKFQSDWPGGPQRHVGHLDALVVGQLALEYGGQNTVYHHRLGGNNQFIVVLIFILTEARNMNTER